MKKILSLIIGLATIVVLTGCEEWDEHHHEHHGGYSGGAYDGSYHGYGYGRGGGYYDHNGYYHPGY